MGTLLPPKTLYPKSMLRPEQISTILNDFPTERIMHTQILTGLWAELDRSLYPSETNKNAIARIEAASAVVRKIAGLVKPVPEHKTPLKDQEFGNLESGPRTSKVSSQKRCHEVELVSELINSDIPPKRARTAKVDITHKLFASTEELWNIQIVWSLPMTEQQKNFLIKMMKELVEEPVAALIKPYTGKHLPLYYRENRKPMGLITMSSRLDTGGYSSVIDLFTDFGCMVSKVCQANGSEDEESVAALELLKCCCKVMRHCPTGPHQEPMIAYSRDAMKFMASQITSQITDATTKPNLPSDKLEVISIDETEAHQCAGVVSELDADKSEAAFSSSDTTTTLISQSSAAICSSMTSRQDEPLSLSRAETAKTPEPDYLDEETRKLQQEIEERQHKLATMIEKKRLLAKIRDLDTEKAAIDIEIPEADEQLKHFNSKIQDCSQMIPAIIEDGKAAEKSRDWFNQESIKLQQESDRLQQESEKYRRESVACREENERLRSVADQCQRKTTALQLEKKQAEAQSDTTLLRRLGLKARCDEIKGERAIAKKIDELDSGSI